VKKAIGYVRVSTNKQDSENQKSAIHEAVLKLKDTKLSIIHEEVISSRKDDRQIYEIVENLKENETLIVYELSRLGRSIGQIHKIIEVVKEKKASILVIVNDLKLGYGLTKDESIKSDVMIFALGLGAQIERDLISERTKNALRARKEQGVTLGRPKGLGKKVEQVIKDKGLSLEVIQNYMKIGLSATKISEQLDIDKRTVREYIKINFPKETKGKTNKKVK